MLGLEVGCGNLKGWKAFFGNFNLKRATYIGIAKIRNDNSSNPNNTE